MAVAESEREIVVTRTFDAPARIVFQAWTTPALMWWVPKSMPLAPLSHEADVRVGGGYRLVFDVDSTKTRAFFGKCLEHEGHPRARRAGRATYSAAGAERPRAEASGGDEELDPRVQRFLCFLVEVSVRSLIEEQAKLARQNSASSSATELLDYRRRVELLLSS